MKNLFYAQLLDIFCVKVGAFPCYFDKDIAWKRLNLSVVRRRNRARCPKLWTK